MPDQTMTSEPLDHNQPGSHDAEQNPNGAPRDAAPLPEPKPVSADAHDVFDDGPPGQPEVDPGANETFDLTMTFQSLGLRNSVLKGLDACGFKHPTKTQAGFIPPIMAGKDILGQAKTGSGKTAAFGLPLLNNLGRETPFQALILAPTRELAIQITGELEDLGRFTPIRAITVYGGQAVNLQARKLEQGAQIVVGTPGRIMDMLERGHLHFRNTRHVVLDEVDRMLDIGFRDDIRRILEQVPTPRQTVFVSATISSEIERLARKYMNEPEKVVVASGSLTVNLVKQFYLPVNAWDKKRLLLHLLRHEEPALTLVFCRLKRHVDEIALGLTARGIDAHAIHGDMSQGKRNKTMDKLRAGQLSVLVASDLAARGIDVEDITHVINFDLPEDPEVYVHRIGRTARAGRGGIAWSFVTPEQGELLTNIELLINQEVPRLEYPDFQPNDTPPEGYRAPHDGRRGGGLTVIHPHQLRPQQPGDAQGEAPAAPAQPQPPAPKAKASAMPEIPAAATQPDASKFPGGVVPTKLPPKVLSRAGKAPGRR